MERKHGDMKAYRRHLREGSEPCEPCREANAVEMAKYRDKKPRDRSADIQRAAVRRRALNRLAEEFPGAYERILAEEEARAS